MAKLLVILALGIVVYLIVNRVKRGSERERIPRYQRPDTRGAGVPEDMVRCEVCGVHLPRSESFTSRGRFFCSDEHRKLAIRKD